MHHHIILFHKELKTPHSAKPLWKYFPDVRILQNFQNPLSQDPRYFSNVQILQNLLNPSSQDQRALYFCSSVFRQPSYLLLLCSFSVLSAGENIFISKSGSHSDANGREQILINLFLIEIALNKYINLYTRQRKLLQK